MNMIEELRHEAANGHSNGKTHANGNGVFSLQPKEDPLLSKIVPAARREVQLDNSLDYGARLLFDYLTDCSLWPGHNVRPGVVRFSNWELSQKFGCCEKTIQNWKRALRDRGRIWTTDKRMRNSYPLTQYHVTAICGQQPLPFNVDIEDGYLAADDCERLTNRRRAIPLQRDAKGKWAKGPPRGGQKSPEQPNTAQTPDTKGRSDAVLPSATATHCVPPTQPVAVQSGNAFRAPQATDCRGSAQPIAEVDGNTLPPTHATGCRDAAQPAAVLGEVRVKRIESPEEKGEAPAPPDGSGGGKVKVTTFPPIPAKIFESKLRKLLSETEATAKAVLAKNRVTEKLPGENIVWLETEAARLEKTDPKTAKAHRAKAAKLSRDPEMFTKRVTINPDALPEIEAWNNRVAEIKGKLARGEFV